MSLNKYILFLFCICLYSCGDDDIGGVIVENADVEIWLASKYNGETFFVSKPGETEHEYAFGNKTLKFTNLNFYLSNFALLIQFSEDNIALDQIEYFDPSLFEGQSAADTGVKVNIGRVPTTTFFDKLFFGFGVLPELNDSKPSDYGGNHPLSNEDLYLENAESYIFLKLEGEVDQDNDGTYDDIFNFNLVFDESYRSFEIPVDPFEVFEGQENVIKMEFDVQALLQNINFETQLTTSESEFDQIMTILYSNLPSALVIK